MPSPTHLTLHKHSRTLEVAYDDGQVFTLTHEFLRVHSPSAEVQGHGPGQETLQVGKRLVSIESIDTVGHYAVQPRFNDGHHSGLFSWDFLYFLGTQQATLWDEYLLKLQHAKASRDADSASDAVPASTPSSCAPTTPNTFKEITR
jgi:DUF971 family protein